ncbi:MAG TPA: hypothetical protein EYF98_16390 [Planctomycetes bacterium]|nr:hypothetical protein [Planctomycetota bacterium]
MANKLTQSLLLTASLLAFSGKAFSQCVVTTNGSGIQCATLFAGQTIDAGNVCIEIVGTDLVISYNTSGGWELIETHVWVGSNLSNMPQTQSGNPQLGNFPYLSGDITGATSWSVNIALGSLNFSCPGPNTTFYVAAHAALRLPDGSGGFQTETGWSDGDRFVQAGSWATYTTINLSCDCGPTPGIDIFCTANGSAGTTVDCPCGNNVVPGALEGCINSSGAGAALSTTGTPSIAAGDLVLNVTGLPGSPPGVFFAGDLETAGGQGTPFWNGLRCVSGNMLRLAKISETPAGLATLPGPNFPPLHQLVGASAGDTTLFQFWYRDPGGPCGFSANMTNGVRVVWGL